MQAHRRLVMVAVAVVAVLLVATLVLAQRPPVAVAPVITPETAAAPASPLAAPVSPLTTPVSAAGPVPAAALTATQPAAATPAVTATSPVSPTAALTVTGSITAAAPVTTAVPVTTETPVTAYLPLTEAAVVTSSLQTSAPVFTYTVLAEYPHDPDAFTQGLQYIDGELYEGTGLEGASSLRQVNLATGVVVRQVDLPPQYFGEGIAVVDDRIYQLTWKSQLGFVYDRATFDQLQTFSYPIEGWGLTYDGEQLIMSDGSDVLRFWDPVTLTETARIHVRDGEQPVYPLNELEYVEGQIFANVWLTDLIARIDPVTGQVTGWLNLKELLPETERPPDADVLNGIAFDPADRRLLVTGKLWPKLYAISLPPAP